jgi:hypothetical protein
MSWILAQVKDLGFEGIVWLVFWTCALGLVVWALLSGVHL